MSPDALFRRLLAVAFVALPLSACFGLSDSSDEGSDCIRAEECEDLCSPIGECVLESTALDIRVNWTINGTQPSPASPASCGSITNFELRFESESIRDEPIAYFPVPCANGTVFYPAMPPRLVRLTLSGVDEADVVIASETRDIVSQKSELFIDFSL